MNGRTGGRTDSTMNGRTDGRTDGDRPGQQSVWDVLDVDDSIVGAPPSAQSDVHFELDVHEDDAPDETDRNHDQLGPKRPLKITYDFFVIL